jgi:regulator of ribonuclease activity B
VIGSAMRGGGRFGFHGWALLSVCAWLACAAVRAELLDGELSRDELQQRFAALRAASLPVDAPLEWEFVFAGTDARALEALSVRLVKDGYRIVGLRGAAEAAALRVARIEQHTPLTLERRNGELRGAASRYAGVSYEGAEPRTVR